MIFIQRLGRTPAIYLLKFQNKRRIFTDKDYIQNQTFYYMLIITSCNRYYDL